MLHGRYGQSSGRPFLEGYISFPRLQCAGLISFLVDTGADKTVIGADDAVLLPVRYDILEGGANISGIGGVRTIFTEPAVLAFADSKSLYLYHISVVIVENDPDGRSIPSVLGRDILDKWRMTYCPSESHLVFDVLEADAEFSRNPQVTGPGGPPSFLPGAPSSPP